MAPPAVRHPTLPIGLRELRRRQHFLGHRVGREILDLRTEANVTQTALAAGAGIDQAHLSRIERGLVRPSLDTLVAIAASLGGDVGVKIFPGSGPRILDRFQAPMVDCMIRALLTRWRAVPELPVPRAHGVIDLAICSRARDLCIAAEAQSELRSIDLTIRRIHEKSAALAELGTFGAEASSLLVVRSTVRTRDLARIYEATLAAAFPARIVDAVAALTTATVPWPGSAIVWIRVVGGAATLLDRPPRGVRLGT